MSTNANANNDDPQQGQFKNGYANEVDLKTFEKNKKKNVWKTKTFELPKTKQLRKIAKTLSNFKAIILTRHILLLEGLVNDVMLRGKQKNGLIGFIGNVYIC